MLIKIDAKKKAIIKSYLRAVLAAAIATAISRATDIAPEYAVLIGAIAAPLIKWVDKSEKEYGLVIKKKIK